MSEGNVVDLSVEILKEIRGELRGLRGDVGELRTEIEGTNQRLDALNARVDVLENETIRGFSGVHRRLEQLNDRVEGIHEIAGDRWRDHERRIARLERRSPRSPTRS